ncbi:MAG: DUF2066 domain-containing protein [Parvibaculaceae bacterium]|nr:DUF2066 domain-containing protein [Parvibaculaceae bacterium]
MSDWRTLKRAAQAAFLSIIALFALGVSPSLAADAYSVSGVHVDETAKSATEARTVAQANGQVLALTKLMQRLTQKQYWPNLPVASAINAENMVRSFQVASEKTSSTRYIADLIVSFRPDAVQGFLAANNIPFTATAAKPAVIVPVLEGPSGQLLWDDVNPWRTAWGQIDLSDSVAPLIMPLSDLEDMSTLPTDKALSGDMPSLRALAARYGAGGVLVALAKPDASGSGLDVTLTRYNGDGKLDEITQNFSADPSDPTPDALYAAAAKGSFDALADRWKSGAAVSTVAMSSLDANISFTSLAQWQAIRSRLDNLAPVRRVNVEALGVEGAIVGLNYVGTPDELTRSMADQSLDLFQGPDGWRIASHGE